MTGAVRIDDAPWLQSGAVQRVFDILDATGEEARVVGGAVRNALMGLPVGEIDIATTAVPDEVVRRAGRAHLRSVPTGIDHGTVTVIVDGQLFEVTTLREDVETFGRRAKVAFGRDWKRDAQRRDFTMNALSVTRDGQVYDYVGGLADLKARQVRFIGDAAMRIAEDYLRILRFFRFHAAFGVGALGADALAACIAGRNGLDTLSRERVRMEIVKLLAAPGAAATAVVMADAGLLGRILGGVPLTPSLTRMMAIESAMREDADATRRLAALAVLVSEDADRLMQRLRLSGAEHQRLADMAEQWSGIAADMTPDASRRALYRLGPERYRDAVMLAWSRSQDGPDDASWRALTNLPQHWRVPDFPISAAELMERGVVKGPALGAALHAAEEAWIAAGFPSDKAALAALADRAAAAHRHAQT